MCVCVQVTQASKVWGEVPLPEDLEEDGHLKASLALLDDDEDFAADEASGGERVQWAVTRGNEQSQTSLVRGRRQEGGSLIHEVA